MTKRVISYLESPFLVAHAGNEDSGYLHSTAIKHLRMREIRTGKSAPTSLHVLSKSNLNFFFVSSVLKVKTLSSLDTDLLQWFALNFCTLRPAAILVPKSLQCFGQRLRNNFKKTVGAVGTRVASGWR